ncbi:antiterminator LoaP [Thomasclavelia sp.]|uniref:antiterminator LoaP n=1 Tax=Thomasclavelia sp. TaxID=3025757 RepID=UPI0025FA4577|nr:antiterminator LoaP [Thomasclavelia sp.]
MCNNWYVIQVRSGREEEIKNTCMKLITKDVLHECFIPRTIRKKKFRGTWIEIEEILFKGYVFMVTDQIDVLFNKLKMIPDLTKVLGNDGEFICPLLKEEVLFLMNFGKEDHIVSMSTGYIVGDKVNIIHGPLMNHEGMIKKIDRHKRIAYIEVSLFDQVVIVQVGLEIISKK